MSANRAGLDPHPGLPDPRPLRLGARGTGAHQQPGDWHDHGSHPEWDTEWWYITGHLGEAPANGVSPAATALPSHAPAARPAYGFQLTFFRSRVPNTTDLHSALAARHLISAHLAVSDVRNQRLLHEERIARATADARLGLGEATVGDLGVRLGNWQLVRDDTGPQRLHARLPGRELGLDLRFDLTQAPIVQGDGGLSRKGPDARQVSYYYSLPQLRAHGELRLASGQRLQVQGRAWLDHEWSTALMHPQAVGWDWIGMNLNDGSALTAFRLRDAQGRTIWTGGSWRAPPEPAEASAVQTSAVQTSAVQVGAVQTGAVRVFGGQALQFEPLTTWRSPATQASYPVHWRIRTPVGVFGVRALIDAQELDATASTGAIYWEGLSELQDERGRVLGWGYLEMTGYAGRLRL
ncbi:hypothetical protein CCO03_10915 [Comamonas serinivorans]|uniref:AttH domain-containing protein n=2 Tax=Comamonas serinivorans TaxID=1082851 RepID=A0A1Y0ESY4_9BURK|nr:hypothetical protein CCO03_10915 [Comamonas serinivorans]